MNTLVETSPAATTSLKIPLFIQQRSNNIDIVAISSCAIRDIESVRTIAIPSIVKTQKRGQSDISEVPTMVELGGKDVNFCQIIADQEGRPIPVENVIFMNTDPNRPSAKRGVVGIEPGFHFSLAYVNGNNSTILIYKIQETGILDLKALNRPVEPDGGRAPEVMARLTCELVGWFLKTWKGPKTDIPQPYLGIYCATLERMKSSLDVPVYIDVFRKLANISDDVAPYIPKMRDDNSFNVETVVPERFMASVFNEILDIRVGQYSNPTRDEKVFRPERMNGIEFLTLINPESDSPSVEIKLTLIRNDQAMPQTFRTLVTRHDFTSDQGQMFIEKGLVLNCRSFEHLVAALRKNNNHRVEVQVMSMR